MATSARKENRWRRTLQRQNDERDQRKLTLEAMAIAHSPRLAVVAPPSDSSRREVRAWMRRNACDYETATHLAEAANAALRLPYDALDDETHWVWDEAAALF